MNLINVTLLIFCLFLFSCGGKQTKKPAKKKANTTAVSTAKESKPKANRNQYWTDLGKSLSLKDEQIQYIKERTKKYNQEKKNIPDSLDSEGEKKYRKDLKNQFGKDIKAKLGRKKYAAYKEYVKDNKR